MSEDNSKTRPQMWIDENLDDFYATRFRLKKTLFSGVSEFQRIDVVETEGFGKMLFNDGLAMVSERDEMVYHDMIAHVPMFVHPNPRRVLVIGGGDGGTVREVIRHPSVEFCQLVEIDPLVVEGCKKHIPQTSAALADEKVSVLIDDGVKFVAEKAEKGVESEKFDVILVDSTDPIGPAAPLFGKEFYSNVSKILTDNGIVVSQCESTFFFSDEQVGILKVLPEVFEKVHLYNYSNLTYPGGMWSFSFASKGLCPIKNFDSKKVNDSGLEFSWYNANLHKASFYLPTDQLKKVGSFLSPIPDL